jgi:hypothetical protein
VQNRLGARFNFHVEQAGVSGEFAQAGRKIFVGVTDNLHGRRLENFCGQVKIRGVKSTQGGKFSRAKIFSPQQKSKFSSKRAIKSVGASYAFSHSPVEVGKFCEVIYE